MSDPAVPHWEASSRASPPSLIVPGVYLGSSDNARAVGHLRQLGVSAILNCAVEVPPQPWGEGEGAAGAYHHIALHDSPFADMRAAFAEACEFLDECQRQHHTVLVHCVYGVSRSPTILCAWLMRSQKWTLQRAMEQLLAARRRVRPNYGFQRQLMAYDRELHGQQSYTFDASRAPGVKKCDVCEKEFLPRGFLMHQRSCQAKNVE